MSFDRLPTELVDTILSELDVASLRAFRLTSRRLYDRSFNTFANSVANQRWLLRENSLSTLQAASLHPHIGKSIKTFRLGTQKGLWAEFPSLFCCEETFREAWYGERTLGGACMGDKVPDRVIPEIQDIDGFSTVIADAILGLPALRNIEIGEFCDAGSFYELGFVGSGRKDCATGECHGDRGLDTNGPGTPGVLQWKAEAENLFLLEYTRWRLAEHWRLSKCLQQVLHALTLLRLPPSTQTLESLSVVSCDGLSKELHGVHVDEMDLLRQDNPLFVALQSLLANVRELKLAVKYCDRHYGAPKFDNRNPESETWLAAFLKLLPRLKTLHLYLDGWSATLCERHISCKSRYHEAVVLFFQDTRFQYLSQLKLCSVVIKAENFEHFVDFLQRHVDQLAQLTLTSILLNDFDSWNNSQLSWLSKLDVLCQIPWKLSYLKLAALCEKQSYSAAKSNPYKDHTYNAVVVFSESSQLQGCDECLSTRWQDTYMGDAPLCGHTMYESQEGRWPATDVVSVCRRNIREMWRRRET